ncbi:TPA: aminoacyl-tRNA hydrolase [Candidatus Saccharibacteria bacterium]|nr:MAG: Peptidyl-tRNA hydrolase [Candidatus Saccharibacteria bacterium GW2011_GWA2_46_10]OGL34959.1 MAG: aminoacyl-tRNA hydrolase [Candidatus Saccharibacteria bacterium RIFCSPHIGHO2_12_FULL_47_17]HCM51778.1 aminoacyl-tRNA hydrolase [Candidatus Saccharibacteria bacterium]
MALFQKQPITQNQPLYTISGGKSLLVIGLGNPVKKYAGTRHNIGFMVVDEFAKANDFAAWHLNKSLKSEISLANLGQSRVILAKPQTFVNKSGEAVQAVQHFYKVGNSETLVIYDELALPFGQLRTRLGGSDAGHNGVKSLISHIGEDFGRLRIGISSELADKSDAEKFVLARFSKAEQVSLTKILGEANTLITEYVFSGQLPHDTRTII